MIKILDPRNVPFPAIISWELSQVEVLVPQVITGTEASDEEEKARFAMEFHMIHKNRVKLCAHCAKFLTCSVPCTALLDIKEKTLWL